MRLQSNCHFPAIAWPLLRVAGLIALSLWAPFGIAAETGEPPPHPSVGQRFVPTDVDWARPVYQTSFDDLSTLSDWKLEGGKRMSIEDGKLVLESEHGELSNHLVCWLIEEMPADFLLEFTVRPQNRKNGLNIVFFSTRGVRGENIFDPVLQPRSGVFNQYHSSDLNGYHISYWAGNRGTANLRKNAGFKLVATGPDRVFDAPADAFQVVRLYKRGGTIRLMVDDVISVAFDDDGNSHGQVWNHKGWIGLRQMGRTGRCEYDNLKVFRVASLPLQVSGAEVAGDDTFGILDQNPLNVFSIRKTFDYRSFVQPDYPSNTIFDARGSVFHHQVWPEDKCAFSVVIGRAVDWRITPPLGHAYWDRYPYWKPGDPHLELLRKWAKENPRDPSKPPQPPSAPMVWLGGAIWGRSAYNATWSEMKAHSHSGFAVNAENAVIDGLRVHNTGDGIQLYWSKDFTVKNCWFSHIRDEPIENDGCQSGIVEDCLVDGTFVFYSSVHGIKTPWTRDNHVVIKDCLVRLESMTAPYTKNIAARSNRNRMGHGIVFKMHDDDAPKLSIINCVFYTEEPEFDNPSLIKPSPPKNVLGAIGAGQKEKNGRRKPVIVESRNNTLIYLWKGAEAFPVPPGFTLVTDKEQGRKMWAEMKAKWIDNHPKVARIEGVD